MIMISQMSLTAIILTKNEEAHIERAISSALKVASRVVVVDSFSSDNTVDLAIRAGAEVYQNVWVSYAQQYNWALDNTSINTDWIMRLDADEYLDSTIVISLKSLDRLPYDVTGIEINRPVCFRGTIIRYGAMNPVWLLRVWRRGLGRCETRWMDEHIILERGKIRKLGGSIVDYNLKDMTWWADKHNKYASREAADLILAKHKRYQVSSDFKLNRQAAIKRWAKDSLYARSPLFVRAFIFSWYRIILRLGFLDGVNGLVFHTMQGLWYRLLVDAKISEVNHYMKKNHITVEDAIRHVLGIDADVWRNGQVHDSTR